MGAPQSRMLQIVSAIKSRDELGVVVTWPNETYVEKTIRYDEQEFDRSYIRGPGQVLIQVDECQWPRSLPYGWGVGTEFPQVEVKVIWKEKICKFYHDAGTPYNVPKCVTGLPTHQYFIYEDGIHVGSEPHGLLWGKYKDKRRVIKWSHKFTINES